jgi:hypothetical protein
VRFANRAAEEILAEGAGLHVSGGIVHAGSTDETCTLRKAIAGCVDTAAHGGGTASGRVRLSRGGGRRPLGVPVIPLRPQAPWTRLYQPSAILFVNDPERDVAVRSDHLRDSSASREPRRRWRWRSSPGTDCRSPPAGCRSR